jgi:hypothetical protein
LFREVIGTGNIVEGKGGTFFGDKLLSLLLLIKKKK